MLMTPFTPLQPHTRTSRDHIGFKTVIILNNINNYQIKGDLVHINLHDTNPAVPR